MNRTWIALALCGATLACGGDAPEEDLDVYEENPPVVEEPVASSEVATEFAPELEVDLAALERRDSGLHVQTLTEGTGAEVASGQTAVVHYTGWLPDGSSFDSSVEGGEPFPFLLGAGRVIPGWDEGVAGMKVGEKRRLVIPPALGYGAAGAGEAIPPNATLVFDVELIEIQ